MTNQQFLVIAGMFALLLAMTALRRLYYASRRSFRFGDETFVWVPGGRTRWNPFAKEYGGGYFLYEDETPVTDAPQIEALRDHWNAINRPRSY